MTKKTFIFLSFLGILLLAYYDTQHFAYADGKVVVQLLQRNVPDSAMLGMSVSPRWTEPVDQAELLKKTEKPTVTPRRATPGNASRYPVQNLVFDPEQGVSVELPEPQPGIEHQSVFLRGNYRALLAWNGKTDEQGEEILIVEALERSTSRRREAVLSIIPLPGKPIAIERTRSGFDSFRELLKKKYHESGIVSGSVVPDFEPNYSRIAGYTIFVLKINDLYSLASDINDYLFQVYHHDAYIMISPEEFEVLQAYWDRGFRYFAFDLSTLLDQPMVKAPVVFHFSSSQAWFPLQIGAIGGTGDTLVDLIVLTPDTISLSGAIKDNDVVLVGNTTVKLDTSEFETIQPVIADFFKKNGNESVLVRNFLIEGKIANFSGDFLATGHKPPDEQPVTSDTTDNQAD